MAGEDEGLDLVDGGLAEGGVHAASSSSSSVAITRLLLLLLLARVLKVSFVAVEG